MCLILLQISEGVTSSSIAQTGTVTSIDVSTSTSSASEGFGIVPHSSTLTSNASGGFTVMNEPPSTTQNDVVTSSNEPQPSTSQGVGNVQVC